MRACAIKAKKLSPNFGRGKKLSANADRKCVALVRGPLAGWKVKLGPDMSSLPIVCKGMVGRYVACKWVSAA